MSVRSTFDIKLSVKKCKSSLNHLQGNPAIFYEIKKKKLKKKIRPKKHSAKSNTEKLICAKINSLQVVA